MGKIRIHLPVKLIVGFIFNNQTILTQTETILKKYFGKIDFENQAVPFTNTDYYKDEIGKDLKRKFISFEKLIPAEKLYKIKIFTNKIENRLSFNNKRRINIDPGYLNLSKVVLASTKDYTHRIYLNKGIYAEITLYYRNKTFTPWDWTYPDYRTPDYIAIFNQIREIYAQQS